MLGVFRNGVVEPPQELHSPITIQHHSKTPEDVLKEFLASNPNNGFSLGFSDKGFLAYAPSQLQLNSHQRLFASVNDVYCIFIGRLNNLNSLNKQYGVSKGSGNEAMFVIEAYCTLRDRSPIPAHRVLQELEGSFGFLVYDHKAGIVFAANGGDKAVNLYWGIAGDGSVMISDNLEFIKPSCAKSFAPFPPGCMYHSDGGLRSFEHPMKKMMAMPRVDSEGALCGAYFAVDAFSRVNNAMPRVDSAPNWSTWG